MTDDEEFQLHCICALKNCYCTKLVDITESDPRVQKIIAGSTDYELPCADCQKGKHHTQLNPDYAERYVYGIVDSVANTTKRAMDKSSATIIMLSAAPDGKLLLELGLAALHDKPIILIVFSEFGPMSDRIKKLADEIIYTDRYQFKAPEFQHLLGATINRILSRGRIH